MSIKVRVKELLAIKERRENRRITYKTILEETGLAEATIAAYLNNTAQRYDRDVLKTWVDYLGVSINELFIDEPES